MTTSISSEARKKQISILIRGRENHAFPKPDGQTDGHTDGHADGRTLVFIEYLRNQNRVQDRRNKRLTDHR